MRSRATATFDIVSWEEEPYFEQDGVKLSRTRVGKTFHGEIEGQSTAELLMAGAQEGSAAYVGLERIVGRIHGRSGSFVLHHSATQARGAQSARSRRAGRWCRTQERASCGVRAGRRTSAWSLVAGTPSPSTTSWMAECPVGWSPVRSRWRMALAHGAGAWQRSDLDGWRRA